MTNVQRFCGDVKVSLVVCLSVVFALASCSLAANLPKEKEISNSLGMKLVRIEPGEFTMGAGDAPPQSKEEWLQRDEDEAPAHKVKISRPYYLGAHELTNAQFEQFAPGHKKFRGLRGASERDDEPVVHVTWQQAVDFCNWLSQKEGRPYRLPTEAEWEYACRAGTTTPFHTGEKLSAAQANFGRSADGQKELRAQAVGKYEPNPWGLYDMHGNVAEWCLDWFGPYQPGEASDPVGRATGTARVVRGWSWLRAGHDTERFARSSNRSGFLPIDANRYTGIRVVLGEMPMSEPLPPAEPPLHQQSVKQDAVKIEKIDGTKPYFVDYDDTDANPSIPPNTWGPIFSQHNHFSTAVACPNGDVLAVWYTCSGESDRQLAQAASRLRAGSDKWEPASFFFGTPDVNTHAPVLLRDGKRIYHFCTQSLRGWDDATDIVRYSDDSGATWSAPAIMVSRDEPMRMSQPCSAFVAHDGAIVVACDGDAGHRDERLVISRDKGKSWTVARGDMRSDAGDRYVIHPAIVERKDGAVLAFMRGPDPMPQLISKNLGESWELHESPFGGIGVGQKAAVLRLASGAILLLTSDSKRKLLGGGVIVALSLDEGQTWPHARKVEAPVGGYMSLAQDDAGKIYLIGSRMHFAACNEAWIRAGKPLPK